MAGNVCYTIHGLIHVPEEAAAVLSRPQRSALPHNEAKRRRR